MKKIVRDGTFFVIVGKADSTMYTQSAQLGKPLATMCPH